MDLPFLVALVVLNLSGHFLPDWTRPDLFFGVTVRAGFRQTEDGRSIVRRYRAILWVFCAAAIAILYTAGFVWAFCLQFVGSLCAMAWAHRRALSFAVDGDSVRLVDLTAAPERLPGGWPVSLLPTLSLAALAVWASRNWERIPARLPIHWGLQGPDQWVERSTAGVYGFIAFHAMISLLLVMTAWGILHWSARPSASAPGVSPHTRRFRDLNIRMLLLVSYAPAVLAWLAMLQPDFAGPRGVVILTVLIYSVLLIRLQRRTTAGDGTPDACWKLGIFYVNPNDSAVFVRKRFGIGYTLNFGNVWSWVSLGTLLVLIVTRSLLK